MSNDRDSKTTAPWPDDDQPWAGDDEATGALALATEEAEAFYVAPNWKLVWWRFRKHKLAVARRHYSGPGRSVPWVL